MSRIREKDSRRIPENQIDFDRRVNQKSKLTVRERFFQCVHKNRNECWTWVGVINHKYKPDAQPFLSLNGVMYNAKRISYAMHNDDFDPVDEVYTICGNPICVNPDHLYIKRFEIDTAKDIRKISFYSKKNGVFLTWNKLRQWENNIIRKFYKTGKLTQKEIGEIFNLNHGVVSHIINKTGPYKNG